MDPKILDRIHNLVPNGGQMNPVNTHPAFEEPV
jgi:hypothetical protein